MGARDACAIGKHIAKYKTDVVRREDHAVGEEQNENSRRNFLRSTFVAISTVTFGSGVSPLLADEKHLVEKAAAKQQRFLTDPGRTFLQATVDRLIPRCLARCQPSRSRSRVAITPMSPPILYRSTACREIREDADPSPIAASIIPIRFRCSSHPCGDEISRLHLFEGSRGIKMNASERCGRAQRTASAAHSASVGG